MALDPIHLVLFFTRGVSLADWQDAGTLERELAVYRTMQPLVRRITLITYGGQRDAAMARDPAFDLEGFQIICNHLAWPNPWYERRLAWLPARWHGAGTIFKSNQINGAEMALRLARRFRRPFIARCGYLLTYPSHRRHGPDPQARCKAEALERLVFTGADRVVVTTDVMQQVVAQRYGVASERIRVIPNPVATDRFCPASHQVPEANRVLFVGRLSPEKNLAALIQAMANLPTSSLPVELHLIGDGPVRPELIRLAADLKVALHWFGRLPNETLPAHMQQAGVFVLPSLYEGHPKALLEAMACGMAVIGTDVPGIREVIRHGETGWLCSPEAEAIQQALGTVLSDAPLRQRLGTNARRAMVETVALERVVQAELALLREIAWNHEPIAN